MSYRFIPASAGNTNIEGSEYQYATVHPRVCGEHYRQSDAVFPVTGSSPRLRGTLYVAVGVLLVVRFIPASAGNTRRDKFRNGNAPVHPRVCGEHAFFSATSNILAGSSPRLRGTHLSLSD